MNPFEPVELDLAKQMISGPISPADAAAELLRRAADRVYADLFYVVLRDDDRHLKRHPYVPGINAPGSADHEAMCLAAMHPGHKFYVLKVVRVAAKAALPPAPPPPEGVTLTQIHLPHRKSAGPDFT